jgi:hypothetical protein
MILNRRFIISDLGFGIDSQILDSEGGDSKHPLKNDIVMVDSIFQYFSGDARSALHPIARLTRK